MPYLSNNTPLNLTVGDLIQVTILENDPRQRKISLFKKGETFKLQIASVYYREVTKEYIYHFSEWPPKGFECIIGHDRAILYTEHEYNDETEWFYTNIHIKWIKCKCSKI